MPSINLNLNFCNGPVTGNTFSKGFGLPSHLCSAFHTEHAQGYDRKYDIHLPWPSCPHSVWVSQGPCTEIVTRQETRFIMPWPFSSFHFRISWGVCTEIAIQRYTQACWDPGLEASGIGALWHHVLAPSAIPSRIPRKPVRALMQSRFSVTIDRVLGHLLPLKGARYCCGYGSSVNSAFQICPQVWTLESWGLLV